MKKGEKGSVVLLLVVLLAVMALTTATALRLVNNQMMNLNFWQHSDEAVNNAETGVHKYLWELNRDSSIYQNGSRFAVVSDSSQQTVYRSLLEPFSGDNYRVEMVVPKERVGGSLVPVTNRLIIRCTGWAADDPQRKRTVEVEVRKRTFAQFAMVNDTEKSENGNKVYWMSGEALYGPLHTNSVLYINGSPVFYGPVTYTEGVDPSSAAKNSNIFRAGCSKADEVRWPSTNADLMAFARIAGQGHYYNGRTCLMLRGDHYDVRNYSLDKATWTFRGKTYQVKEGSWYYNGVPYELERRDNDTDRGNFYVPAKNPKLVTGENAAPVLAKNESSFDAFKADLNSLGLGYSLPLPANGVIYVNGNQGGLTDADSNYKDKFDPKWGNLFVSGSLKGSLTLASANDIYITGYDPTYWDNPEKKRPPSEERPGLTYSSITFQPVLQGGKWVRTDVTGGDDLLGLVADRYVKILHYGWPRQPGVNEVNSDFCYLESGLFGRGRLDMAVSNFNLQAAVYVGKKSFGFEGYDTGGDMGKLKVFGSIAQRYRGAVGTIGGLFQNQTGYDKEYYHDPRMQYNTPPHYIEPARTGWAACEWKETSSHIEP